MTSWELSELPLTVDLETKAAANYLNKLSDDKMLRKEKLGTGNYYINEQLFERLTKR